MTALSLERSRRLHPSHVKPRAKRLFNAAVNRLSEIGKRMAKSPKAASIKTVVSDHWMKVSGYAGITSGIYQINHAAAWIIAGCLMLVLEHQVSE